MPPYDGWYLIGPPLAAGVVALVGALLQRTCGPDALRDPDALGDPDALRDPDADGLAILDGATAAPDNDDYGLLRPAAVTDDLWLADDIHRLLVEAGIRATRAVRPDGRVIVLVFDESVEEARRLVGDSPVP